MPTVRAIYEEVIERLLNGDMKDTKNSRGWTYVEELARQMLLDPEKAAELTAKASARGCLPGIKASVERAVALNGPKLALLATPLRSKWCSFATCRTGFIGRIGLRRTRGTRDMTSMSTCL
jgi:hypothetical protein